MALKRRCAEVVKDRYYGDKSHTIQALNHNIAGIIRETEAETVENVLKNLVDTMDYCQDSWNNNLNEVVFHQ